MECVAHNPIYFEVKKGDNRVTAFFTAFKQVKGNDNADANVNIRERETSSEKSAIILILKFIKTDNTVQEATIDVTEIIGTLENAVTGEDGKPTPPPEIELPPDDKIEVDKPETPPNPDGGGGMAAMLMDGDPKIMLSYPWIEIDAINKI